MYIYQSQTIVAFIFQDELMFPEGVGAESTMKALLPPAGGAKLCCSAPFPD